MPRAIKSLCPKGCGRSFNYRGLSAHVLTCDGQQVREKERGGYLCRHCGVSRRRLPQLKEHERRCGGGDLLCLKGCGRSFRQQSVRQAHSQCCDGHFQDQDGKLYFCRYACGESARLSRIQDHELLCSREKISELVGIEGDPRLSYATYLELCLEFQLLSDGLPGDLSKVLSLEPEDEETDLAETELPEQLEDDNTRGLMYDLKAEEQEVSDDIMLQSIPLLNPSENSDVDDLADSDDDSDYASDFSKSRASRSDHASGFTPTMETSLKGHNEEVLKRYGLSAEDLPGGQICVGVRWRHGHYTCPTSTVKSITNTRVVVRSRESGNTYLQFHTHCRECQSARDNIKNWILRSKFCEITGKRLCSWKQSCREPVVKNIRYCARHASVKAETQRREKMGSRASWWHNRVQTTTRKGLGSECLDMESMAECLASNDFILPRPWDSVARQILMPVHDNTLFFVDCEFFTHNGKHILIEIAVLDATGTCLIDSKIDYDMDIDKMTENITSIGAQHVRKVYGAERTTGISISELKAKLISIGITKTSRMVEWSTSFCDYRSICDTFDNDPNFAALLPPKHRWLRGITDLWKVLLPGCPSFALDLIYEVVFPEDKNQEHHRAKVDTQKMYKMVGKALFDMCRAI